MTPKHSPRKPHMETLLTLVLFGVFAVSVLFVLLSGAGTYRQAALQSEESYSQRTCARYLAGKVRQAPNGEAVTLTSVNGSPALAITETLEGRSFTTYIYCSDGWLRELFTFTGVTPNEADGEKVLEASHFSANLQEGLLTLTLTGRDGTSVPVVLSLPAGKEASQ